ncbi:hypothetical protein V1522DRAFT_81475, partial [Lipomyces starkeyi]
GSCSHREKCKAVEHNIPQRIKRKLQRPESRSRVRSSQVPSSDAIFSSRIAIATSIEMSVGSSTNFTVPTIRKRLSLSGSDYSFTSAHGSTHALSPDGSTEEMTAVLVPSMVASSLSEFTTDPNAPSTRILPLPDLEQMRLAYILETSESKSPNLQHEIETKALQVIAPEPHWTTAPDPCHVANAAKLLLSQKKGARKTIRKYTKPSKETRTAVMDGDEIKNYYREGPRKYFFQKLSYVPLDELH